MTLRKKIFASVFFLLCSFSSGLYAAAGFDHSAWDAFLKKNVNESGEVDYRSITKDPKELNDYLASLMAVPEMELTSWPREETLAFWLNAYHAVSIKLVADNYPVASVQNIPSFWDIAAFHLGDIKKGQRQYSLNDIREKSLIGVYHDEKIHLALSVAAKSGPKLRPRHLQVPKWKGSCSF